MMRAAVEKATPTIDRIEIILMKFFFRFEKKYRLAMKRGKFIRFSVQNSKFNLEAMHFESG